ncbi:MarR family transcriptional regulator [Sporichthya brevicatena]|uniref:MarR family transcriptional regulator n=2 Tax=Sporichthya brevicatena TaxID=171442 RepID=A0ABN1GEQ9_9ACTN
MPLDFDPIAEAHRQWQMRWPEHADQMAAVTSVMRVQQLLLGEIDRTLKPFGLTFASFEALRLLAFTREGELPMGKIGERLMVHPASVTNTVDKLERAGMVRRRSAPEDRRRVLASITPDGRDLVEKATAALNAADFALPGVDRETAVALTALLRRIRERGNDFDAAAHDPWA